MITPDRLRAVASGGNTFITPNGPIVAGSGSHMVNPASALLLPLNYPQFLRPTVAPRAMSVRRDNPRNILCNPASFSTASDGPKSTYRSRARSIA
jgi:hypothetical protein